MTEKENEMSENNQQAVLPGNGAESKKEVRTISTSEMPEVFRILKFLGLPPVIDAKAIGYYLRYKYFKCD